MSDVESCQHQPKAPLAECEGGEIFACLLAFCGERLSPLRVMLRLLRRWLLRLRGQRTFWGVGWKLDDALKSHLKEGIWGEEGLP